jgi:hypothetical protein
MMGVEVKNALLTAVLTAAVRHADKLGPRPELGIGTEATCLGKEMTLCGNWQTTNVEPGMAAFAAARQEQ